MKNGETKFDYLVQESNLFFFSTRMDEIPILANMCTFLDVVLLNIEKLTLNLNRKNVTF